MQRPIRDYLIVAGLALAAAAGWRVRDADWVQDFLHPQPVKKLKIEFDNGTVRQYETSPPEQARKGTVPMPEGALRKCVRGAEVSYTNHPCPAGSQEHALKQGTLTVLSAPPKPAPTSPQSPQPMTPQPTTPEATLRQQATDRTLKQ